jgi:hypothetical protein
LTGIQNENEFYSDHYLTTVFEGDIKETIEHNVDELGLGFRGTLAWQGHPLRRALRFGVTIVRVLWRDQYHKSESNRGKGGSKPPLSQRREA